MTKRLKYTKDILTHMLNNNTHTNRGAGSSVGGGSITPSSLNVNSQNIHPGPMPHSAATGKRSEMLATLSQGFGNNNNNLGSQDFQTLSTQGNTNMPLGSAIGSHRRPLNIINN